MVGWLFIHCQDSSTPPNPHNYNYIYISCVLLEDPENLIYSFRHTWKLKTERQSYKNGASGGICSRLNQITQIQHLHDSFELSRTVFYEEKSTLYINQFDIFWLHF